MAVTKKKNLSEYQKPVIQVTGSLQIGVVVSQWNDKVTYALRDGAIKTLVKHGIKRKNILVHEVPGSFELPAAAQWMLEYTPVRAVICLGCVIQGETRHFDFICQAVSEGIMQVGLDYQSPVIFGVLTTNTVEQALARAGGKHGNKGVEAAAAALHMMGLKQNLESAFNINDLL